jgi:hypothetical protein
MGWLKDLTGSFNSGLLSMAAILALATAFSASLRPLMKEH